MNKVSAFGRWTVTTEGDVEGRTVRNLGVYEGFIDEIALRLGNEAYYSLHFSPFKERPQPPLAEKRTSVSVQLDIESGTWDMKAHCMLMCGGFFFVGGVVVITGGFRGLPRPI